ncbi:MAG: phosphoadenosine phosphosulfate reductase [Pseudomonadota bacterium]
MLETGRAGEDRLRRLDQATRLARLAEIGRSHGFFQRIGARHHALFVEEGDTLLVTFDAAERVLNRSADGLPTGFPMVHTRQWSLLSIMGAQQSWFRDAELYEVVDNLIDEGFFDRFDRVLFFGRGAMCGYAALAYSVAAPGCHALAISPAATLDRQQAPFERRFRRAWSLNFRDRFGYAPDMIEGAAAVTIVYDPLDVMAAAHAALFRAGNVIRHPLRHGGAQIGAILETGEAIWSLANAASEGPVSETQFAGISRGARRASPAYVGALVARAGRTGHKALALAAARHGRGLVRDGRFDRAIAGLNAAG